MNELEYNEYVFKTISRHLSLDVLDEDLVVSYSEKIWSISNWNGSFYIDSENITDLFPVIAISPVHETLGYVISYGEYGYRLEVYNKEFEKPVIYENNNALEFFKYSVEVINDG